MNPIAEKFVKNGFFGCPYCGDFNFENKGMNSTDEWYIDCEYFCIDCGRYWTEVYTKNGVVLDDMTEYFG